MPAGGAFVARKTLESSITPQEAVEFWFECPFSEWIVKQEVIQKRASGNFNVDPRTLRPVYTRGEERGYGNNVTHSSSQEFLHWGWDPGYGDEHYQA